MSGNVYRLSFADLLMRDSLEGEPRDAFLDLLKDVQRSSQNDQIELVCQRMLEVFPEDALALGSLARVRLRQSNPDEAVALIELALLKTPDDMGLRELLGRAYEAGGEKTCAEGIAREVELLKHMHGSVSEKDPGTAPSLLLTQVADATTPSLVLNRVQNGQSAPSLVLTDLAEADSDPIFGISTDTGTTSRILV